MEEDFPRGTPARPAGPKVLVKDKVKLSAKQAVKRPARDVLFQESGEETSSKVKKKKKKIKKDEETAAEAELESVVVTEMEKFTPRIFSQKTISEGMLVLAAVKEVHEYEVVLSLPNCLKGFVQITDISAAFTQKLQEINVEEGADEESLPSIGALYSIGDLVQCKIKSLSSSKNGHRRIQASLDYTEINADLNSSSVKAGMVINGCVTSIEDHGYTVDLGVRGTKAFLSKQDAKKLVKVRQHNLQTGQPVTCVVKEVKAKGRSVLLNADPATVKKAKATVYSHTTLSTLLPGTKVDATVTKILPNCLAVEILGLYKGCVDVIHVKDKSEDLDTYRIGQMLTGVVLYNCPTTKSLGLSLTAVHQKSTCDPDGRLFADVAPGDIFKEATIVRVFGKISVLVQLTPETRGIVYQTHLCDDKQERHSARSLGDKVQCRVLDVGYFDRLAIVSMRQSVLDKPFLGVKDIKPGMLTKGVVEMVTPRGVAVKIQDRVHGFVPRTHLGDVPIQKPHERFTVGSEIELRVIVVEPAKRRVLLTHKKTMVKSTLPVLTSYVQATMGMWIHGCVVAVKDFGLIVNFYNNVKGIVPRVELGIRQEASPAENFYVGQALKCRVFRVDPENEKLALSLRKDDSAAEKTKRFECLKMVKVKVTKVQPEGLSVTLLPNGQSAFIHKTHLSDHVENCEALMASYAVGDVIDQAMTWSHNAKTRMTFVTCKPILIMASRNNTEIVRNFEELQAGMDLVGVMRHAMSFGVFVEFPNKIVGLAPKAAMADEYVSEASKIFQVGQTLRAKVTEVDLERKRFLVSLRVSECHHGDDLSGGSLTRLETYFTERDRVGLILREKKEFKHLISLTVGSVVHATVRHTQGQGLVCSLPHGVDAVISQHHMTGKAKPNVGDTLEACVLNVDLTNRVAELSIKETLVAECKKRAKSKSKKAKKKLENLTTGDSVTVLLVKDDFALVQTASGVFVYVPAKEHLNSTPSDRDEITVGQSVILGETRQVDGRILAPLSESSRGRKANRSRKGDGKPKKATAPTVPSEVSSPPIGQIINAVIKSVKGTQINVEVEGGTFGRIHATEVTDDLQTGQYPLEALTIGKKVRTKVIGYRFGKRQQHLAVSHSHCGVHLLELSMRPSLLESSDPPGEMDAEEELKGFKPGQSVNCIVNMYDDQNDLLWVHVSRSIEGKVHCLNLSKHVYTLEHPGSFFKQGEVHRAKVVRLDFKHKLLELSMTGNMSEDISAGMTLNCKVTQLQKDTALLQLPFGCHGSVFLTDVNDKLVEKPLEVLKAGQFHRCRILEKRKDGKFSVSLRNSRVKNVPVPLGSDRDVQVLEDLVVGQNIRGYVRHCSSKGIFVSLSRNIHGRILLKNLSNSFVEDPANVFPVGRLITTKILSVDAKTKQVELSSSGKDTGLQDPVPANMRGKKKKKGKGQRSADDGNDSGLGEVDTLSDTEAEIITVTKTSKNEAPRLQLAAGFSWEESSAKPATSGKRSASSRMAEDSDEEEEEEDEEAENMGGKKRDEPPSKKSKKEKAEDDKAEEEYLYKTERALMDAERTPETMDDFDRLVASSPNSSLAWVRYMAFHLHSVDIEKARAVAERALKTINFREEQEKLNVWVAYLNLENLYGTEEDVMSVFQRGLQQCEAIKVFQQLVSIFIRTNKMEQAEQLYESMIKRFKFNPDVWTGFGTFLMKNGRHEQARRLMQRSFKSLVQKDHIGVIVKFAQLEYRHAEPERGKTMFENVLSNYPKRTDIWSIYLDMTIRQGDVEPCRHLFERVIHLNLSAKKIKFFFKRYLDFEKKYGSETSMNAVKQKAVEYVESKTAVMGSDL
ncbi:LOW QUALITY PROTEIN: protein RRP5 homolog [Diadema antillarum]|uniref:LOW QUALITY PROTEIN: protein RRP5 homolog n=1 Tax=Diadema antillarum TaxID=105358 RepID=UPI003A89A2CA